MRTHTMDGEHIGARIRELLLEGKTTYSTSAAAYLSGIDEDDLLARIKSGEVDATIPWDDVVGLLKQDVPLETIYDALGERADEVLPPLLRLERLDVAVPAYVLRVLEWVAKQKGLTMKHYLRGELFDLVASIRMLHPEIDDLPGVTEALLFPRKPPLSRRKP